jgi:predicted ATPase
MPLDTLGFHGFGRRSWWAAGRRVSGWVREARGAARLRILSVGQLAERLDDIFAVLVGGVRTAPRRHQTLRATLEWSHDLLAADERVVFRRLAVFAGGSR